MKKWIALLLAAVLCLCLCACGGKDNGDTTNEVELTTENILDYLNIEITYEKTGEKNVIGQPEMVETITIYPVQGGSFKNVKLLITGFPKEWTAVSSELGSSFAQNTDSSFKPTMTKITLPSDGNYTCTHTYYGDIFAELPEDKDSTKGWDYISVTEIDESYENWFGSDFVKAGDKVITGTFKAD
jgi:hypothetical protein